MSYANNLHLVSISSTSEEVQSKNKKGEIIEIVEVSISSTSEEVQREREKRMPPSQRVSISSTSEEVQRRLLLR